MQDGNTYNSGFRADWRGLAWLLVLLPVLLSLGFWQLQRAEEKRSILAQFEARRGQPPVQLAQLDDPADYRPVILRGRFDPQRYWLLDNRIHRGRFGYQVVSLFELVSGAQVLVNRGWIPGDPGRRRLPEIVTPAETVEVTGEIYRGGKGGYRLEETPEQGWPRRVQWLDISEVRGELGEDVHPFTVRLFEGQPGAFVVDHPVVNVQPQRHTGYAVQWFGIALAAAVFFLARYTNVFQCRRRKDNGA